MARRGKNFNDIPEEKILEAITWLDDGKTKKGACDIMGVSNNKTMERLIDEYLEHKSRTRRLRAEKRKKAVSQGEVVAFITDYLEGDSLQDIAARHYRSVDTIKEHIIKNGAMLRTHDSIDPLNPPIMPDECMAESFKKGELVWSAKYGCIAEVCGEFKNAYRIHVLSEGTQEYSYQPYYELGSLKHLEELGVNLKSFRNYTRAEDCQVLLREAIIKANKRKK